MAEHLQGEPEKDQPNGLTCIHTRIHCVATQDPEDTNEHELDRIELDAFLATLAEIALAVARRKEQIDRG